MAGVGESAIDRSLSIGTVPVNVAWSMRNTDGLGNPLNTGTCEYNPLLSGKVAIEAFGKDREADVADVMTVIRAKLKEMKLTPGEDFRTYPHPRENSEVVTIDDDSRLRTYSQHAFDRAVGVVKNLDQRYPTLEAVRAAARNINDAANAPTGDRTSGGREPGLEALRQGNS